MPSILDPLNVIPIIDLEYYDLRLNINNLVFFIDLLLLIQNPCAKFKLG